MRALQKRLELTFPALRTLCLWIMLQSSTAPRVSSVSLFTVSATARHNRVVAMSCSSRRAYPRNTLVHARLVVSVLCAGTVLYKFVLHRSAMLCFALLCNLCPVRPKLAPCFHAPCRLTETRLGLRFCLQLAVGSRASAFAFASACVLR